MSAETISDLQYLTLNAFAFDVEVNPHAPLFEPVKAHVEHCGFDANDWTSPGEESEASRLNKLIVGRVYPRGSVSFFVSCAATDISAVIRSLAEDCRRDLARGS